MVGKKMIELNVNLKRDNFALNANLSLEARVTGLFGPSGSGKSTLLSILAGLIKPDHGRVVVDGECLFDSAIGVNIPMHQRRIGLVFQESRLFPHLTIQHNLTYGLHLLTRQKQKFGLKQIVDLLDIEHLLKQRPHQLSGGEKQRVTLGRALLSSPRLLLCDEPLAALDTRLKNQILPFLKRVNEEIKVPMIYVSHSINEVLQLTQSIAMIEGGHILASGNFYELMQHPEVLSLAHSLGFDNVIQAKVIEHNNVFGYTIASLNGNHLFVPLLNSVIGADVAVSIPASNIALSIKKLDGLTIQNQLLGVVTAIREVDHRVLVTVDIGFIVVAEITLRALHDLNITLDKPVYCLIKTQAMAYLGVV